MARESTSTRQRVSRRWVETAVRSEEFTIVGYQGKQWPLDAIVQKMVAAV